MAFRDVIKGQRESGKGVAGALGSAALMTLAEKMDPRNYIFKKDSFLSALFPKVKGYKATAGKKDDLKRDTEKVVSKELTDRLDIIAKNTLVLPMMYRDMNVMRQSLVKLVKLAGGQQKDKADKFFLSASERERLYESQFGPRKKETSPQSATKPDKEKKGFFDGLLDFFKGGGLLGLLVKGGLIAGALYGIGKYFTDPEFRNSVHEMLNNFGSAIFSEEGWKDVKENIKVGLLAVVGTFALVKTAMIAFEVFMYSLMRRMAGGMGLPVPDIPGGPDGKGGKGGKGAPGKGGKVGGFGRFIPYALAGVVMQQAGEAVDAGLGSVGVGKDEKGEDLVVDKTKDEKNWQKMSLGEKAESGAARGIEKVADFIGLDNLANQSKADRIKKETEFFEKKETNERLIRDWAYSVFIGAATVNQIPISIKEDVLKLLNNPPDDWKKPVRSEPAKPTTEEKKTPTAVTETETTSVEYDSYPIIDSYKKMIAKGEITPERALASIKSLIGENNPELIAAAEREFGGVPQVTPVTPAGPAATGGAPPKPFKGKSTGAAVSGGGMQMGTPGPTAPVAQPTEDNRGIIDKGIGFIGDVVRGNYGVSTWGLDTTAKDKFGGAGAKGMWDDTKKVLDLIAAGESGSSGDYNAMNQGTPKDYGGKVMGAGHSKKTIGKNLTDMTVGEIISSAPRASDDSLTRRKNNAIFAAGRYQIIPDRLKELVKDKIVNPSEKFTPEVQDRLGRALLYKTGAMELAKKGKIDEAQNMLANMWASVPLATDIKVKTKDGFKILKAGQSRYQGPANSASIKHGKEINEALKNAFPKPIPSVPKSTPPANPIQKNGMIPGTVLGQASNDIAVAKSSSQPVVIDNSKVINQGGGQQGQTRQGQNSKNVANAYDAELFGSMMLRTIA